MLRLGGQASHFLEIMEGSFSSLMIFGYKLRRTRTWANMVALPSKPMTCLLGPTCLNGSTSIKKSRDETWKEQEW